MRTWLAIALMLIGGCVTTPLIPERYHLGVPEARAGDVDATSVVLIGSSAANKAAEDGNTYTIEWFAMTNSNSDALEDPIVIAANADLATNRWPKFRMHMDLSLDGGQTWPRRIGYGLQTPKGGIGSEFVWSPPNDYSLLTTNAVLRLVDLDGNPFRGNNPGATYDVGTNGVRSGKFFIAGAVIDEPAAGSTLYPDTPITVTWRQVGGGSTARILWLTPDSMGDDAAHLLATVSNVVNGVNTVSINLPADLPVAPLMRLCVHAVRYPVIIGYSGDLEVQP